MIGDMIGASRRRHSNTANAPTAGGAGGAGGDTTASAAAAADDGGGGGGGAPGAVDRYAGYRIGPSNPGDVAVLLRATASRAQIADIVGNILRCGLTVKIRSVRAALTRAAF